MTAILEPTWLVLATILIVATVLPLWRHDTWWIRACDFPRVQIAALGLALVAAYLAFLRPGTVPQNVALVLLSLCLAFQIHEIRPYTRLARRQSLDCPAGRPGADLSVMVANVLMTNRRSEVLVREIRRLAPTLVLTVETDGWWEETLRQIEDDYPFTVKLPLDNTYGMLLHSRSRLHEPEVRFLVEDDIPSIHARVRLPRGDTVRLHFVHPKPPHPSESTETTGRDAELLIVGRQVGRCDEPTIVAGDLNDVAWSYTTCLFQRVSGLLDPRIGRGLYSTYHAKLPFLRWPLDHVFHSHHLQLVRLERPAAFGSDHFPVYAELSLEPKAPIVQDEPSPEPGDLDLADAKIEVGEPREEL